MAKNDNSKQTLTGNKFSNMYFCILKTNKNEQTQLLEMRYNASINSWNGAGVFISQLIQLF